MPKKLSRPIPAMVPELAGHLSLVLALYVAADVDAFRDAIFALLHALFPCEFVCMVFQQGLENCQEVFRDKYPFNSPEEIAYFATAIPALERFWTPPRRKVYRYTEFISPEEMKRTEYYRRVMRPLNWLCSAGLLVWKRQRVVALAAVYRSEADGDFTVPEMALFDALHPHFQIAAQRLMLLDRERASRHSLECVVQALPLPTLLLDWDLRVLYRNAAGAESCLQWDFGLHLARRRKGGAHLRVPAALLEACRQLRARWESGRSSDGHGHVTLHSPYHPGLSASLTVTQWTKTPFAEPAFIVQFKETPAAEAAARPPEKQRALLLSLSPCERRIVLAVCAGDTNRHIATTLGKSEATVKKQLQAAYRKLAVSRRTQLAALFHESLQGSDPSAKTPSGPSKRLLKTPPASSAPPSAETVE